MNKNTNEVAVIKTTTGEMVVEFWPEVAPNTVENFKKLAQQGFYDGTASHRLIRGFMIQMGDPYTKDPSKEAKWGQGDPGYKIKAEFNARKHERGVLSMARSADPDSAGSQFFICFRPQPGLDGQYTTFGQLIKGEDVLAKLEATPCGPVGTERRASRCNASASKASRSCRPIPSSNHAQQTASRPNLLAAASAMNLTDLAAALVSVGCPQDKIVRHGQSVG